MSEVQNATQAPWAATLAPRGVAWTVEKRELAVFAVATLAAWAHTIDEMRIGEFIAVPFGVANAALVGAWPRLGPGWRAATATVFGLFWSLAVIPYHVVPLLEGSVTGQNVSGLSRLLGGAAMVALAIAIWRRRGGGVAGASQR
jgi:hypothetical protein